ncbi:serine hydrolase domain-containing protein [Rossellomorea marisflavi]|uniref:serine hydrolase domain-containing protein n=1 Tax=Rossellomorea TaxID=2837508 RepID=UPI0035CD2BFE
MNLETSLIPWVEDIARKNDSSGHALYIMKDGKTVLEHYGGYHSFEPGAQKVNPTSRFNIASARKSYIGLMVAYALYDGLLKIDQPVHDYVKVKDPVFRGVSIRHLLTHTHGIGEGDSGLYTEFTPGENWSYNNVGVDTLAHLVMEMYGVTISSFLQGRIFNQLEWVETGWMTETSHELVKIIGNRDEKPMDGLHPDSDGTRKNLFVSARELAWWGQLHLDKGKVGNRQIVPEEVVNLATSIHTPESLLDELPRNGAFWYVQDIPRMKSEIGDAVPAGSYQILGVTGPTILVIPKYQIVAVKMYNKRYNYGGADYLRYLKEFSNRVADACT